MKKTGKMTLIAAMLLVVVFVLSGCISIQLPSSNEQSSSQGGSSNSADLGYSSSAEYELPNNANSSNDTNNNSNVYEANLREVKFKDDAARSDWNTLYQDRYIYYWSDSNNKMTEWPGEKMQKTSDGYYTYTVPADASYILFDAGTDLYQTVDIPFDGSVKDYQLTGNRDDDGKYTVETWSGGSVQQATGYDSVQSVSESQLGVSVEGISIQNGYYSGSFSTNGGSDAVLIRIKNNLSTPVKSVTLYAVFFDSSGSPVSTIMWSYSQSKVAMLTTNDLIIQPGETAEVGYACDASSISSQNVIVASYTTSDRIRYDNSSADSWAAQYD